MGKPKYYSLEDAISLIDSPNREICFRVLSENKYLFKNARGSKTKHQAWPGGYLDHIKETMNLAILLYNSLESTKRRIPFNLSDSLLVMFLHDIEKPWKQLRKNEIKLEDERGKKDEDEIKKFKSQLIHKYGFKLNSDHQNALRYVEGENKDYDTHKRISNELAAFCHMCDYWSARGWHDFPKKEKDTWKS